MESDPSAFPLFVFVIAIVLLFVLTTSEEESE